MTADINWPVIYPELAICLTAFLLLIADLVLPKSGRPGALRSHFLAGVAFIGVFVALQLIYSTLSYRGESFFGMITNDPASGYFKIIFCLAAALAIFASVTYQQREFPEVGEFYVLLLFSTFGAMIMASSLDLITLFLGLEMMSIPLYVLAGIYHKRYRSQEAALKYFLLGAFATGFLLYGIAFYYGAFGTTNVNSIAEKIAQGQYYSVPILLLGSMLLLVGLAFKAGLVPFHMWIPDVYEGAPAPVTAFMSTGPKAAAVIAILRVFVIAVPLSDMLIVFWVLGVLTMTWGNILAITQDNVKRMLAYSSIAHAGYVMVAVTAGGVEGTSAAAFYLLAYTLTNIGAFAIVILFASREEARENIGDYSGFAYHFPFAAIAMTIFLASLGGIPGTAGFMAKFIVFAAAIKKGFIWLAVIGVLNSLVSIFYYLRLVVAMYMKPQMARPAEVDFSPSLLVAVIVALLGVLQIGLFPESWLSLANLAAALAF